MSKIEWTDKTWNPIVGCKVHSPGCTNCYAMRMAHRLARMGQAKYGGLTHVVNGKPVWNGAVAFDEAVLEQPLSWKSPKKIFAISMGDLFWDAVTDEMIDTVFAVMALCPQHTFQVLTKRPNRMHRYLRFNRYRMGSELIGSFEMVRGVMLERWRDITRSRDHPHGANGMPWPLPNVWLGTSVEDQPRFDERIPFLLQTPASVRFMSGEPLLGPIDATAIRRTRAEGFMRPLDGRFNTLDWVIAGGESGPGKRPVEQAWVRDLRDQCQAAGVPFFFKQWGGATPKAGGRNLDGRTWDQFPEVGDG